MLVVLDAELGDVGRAVDAKHVPEDLVAVELEAETLCVAVQGDLEVHAGHGLLAVGAEVLLVVVVGAEGAGGPVDAESPVGPEALGASEVRASEAEDEKFRAVTFKHDHLELAYRVRGVSFRYLRYRIEVTKAFTHIIEVVQIGHYPQGAVLAEGLFERNKAELLQVSPSGWERSYGKF